MTEHVVRRYGFEVQADPDTARINGTLMYDNLLQPSLVLLAACIDDRD